MKFSFLFIGFLMIINPIFAQPQKINYQAVAVGANGKPIKNSTVGLRLSVLDSLPTGSTLYTETQVASTDASGQFSIYLGGGTATAGTFANLPWANGNDKFLKVEMDAQGGTNYQPMGTTQLVSMPYAMAAGSLREGALLYGNSGQQYQLTIGINGPTWTCYPPVTVANAGADQLNVCGSSVTLAGNSPSNGTATWGMISGAGGSLGTANAPSTTFAGVRGNSYNLRYSITNACGSSTDTVAVSLAPTTTVANAGPDQLNLTGTTATLAANTPATGETGSWSILTGSGGSLNSNSNPSATFTKGTDSAYTLVWTITGPCGISRDTVNLLFPAPIGPNCGQSISYAGENYSIVSIGNQCWLNRNLNVGTMVNGTANQTNNGIIEKYCYNNTMCSSHGGLYQWAEAVQYQNGASNTTSLSFPFSGNVKGICPTGWHIPSDAEFCTLSSFFEPSVNCNASGIAGINAGTSLKSSLGFYSRSYGNRVNGGSFSGSGTDAFFMTSTEAGTNVLIAWNVYFSSSYVYRIGKNKDDGLSVRCLKD